ncbi:MAG: ATP-dependent DNA helicase, partial [Microcystaceae cyanobacterium]
TALKSMQQAVLPLRENQGAIAIFDHRVNSRSYGSRILEALEPYAKSNYIDPSWFR